MTRGKLMVFCAAAVTAGFCLTTTGCASTAKKAGEAAATSSVQGAKTGAKATAKGVQGVGSTAADAVIPNRNR